MAPTKISLVVTLQPSQSLAECSQPILKMKVEEAINRGALLLSITSSIIPLSLVDTVACAPSPGDVTSCNSFLGLASYFRNKKIRRPSSFSFPLH